MAKRSAKSANVFHAKETPSQWEGVNRYVVMDPSLEVGGGPIIPPEGGGPVDPGYSPPWAQVPGGGTAPGQKVYMIPLPATDPATPPPAGMAAGAVQVLCWMGPGTIPTTGWVNPYATTGPVEGEAAPQ